VNPAVQTLLDSLSHVYPETILVGAACLFFLLGPFLVTEAGVAPAGLRHRWGALTLAALLAAIGMWLNSEAIPITEAQPLGPFRLDSLTWYIRGLALLSGVLLLLIQWNQADDSRAAEVNACLLLIIAGTGLTAAANDLVSLFLALELVSIPTYVLLYLPRRDQDSQEAVLKYFLLSVLSSALVLYGFSLLYGLTGTTNLGAIYEALWANRTRTIPPVLVVSAVMIIAGLSFRVTAVPFHFYAPDVFQGTHTAGAAMLAVIPKIVGFVVLLRLLATPELIGRATGPMWTISDRTAPLIWALAALTMVAGNVLALLQTNIKRLLAYSSIAHAGYMLVGLSVAGSDLPTAVPGVRAVLFYLAVYALMTAGVFAVIVFLSRPGQMLENIDDFNGLSQTHPAAAILMTVFLFSLTGLPPTAGFLGKLGLFLAAWSQGPGSARVLAWLMAFSAAVSAWYYLKITAAMYLQDPTRPKVANSEWPAFVGITLCAAGTIGLFVAPGMLWKMVEHAAG